MNVRIKCGLLEVCRGAEGSIRLDGCKCRLKRQTEWSSELCFKDGGEREPAFWRALEADRAWCREGRDGKVLPCEREREPESARLDLGRKATLA